MNYALDRRALADAFVGGVAILLPAGARASRAPAARRPIRLAPDLAKARALAKGRGGSATIIYSAQGCDWCARTASLVRQELAAIGVHMVARPVPDTVAAAAAPGGGADALFGTYFYDYPDPSAFVNAVLDPDHPLGYDYPAPFRFYDDARFQSRARAANLVAGAPRASAYRALVADMMRESPPLAAFGFVSAPQLVSGRIGCTVFRPQDGGYLDLAAACRKSPARPARAAARSPARTSRWPRRSGPAGTRR